jgi:hypothetical protein
LTCEAIRAVHARESEPIFARSIVQKPPNRILQFTFGTELREDSIVKNTPIGY